MMRNWNRRSKMDERLKEVLEGKEGNYLLPFLWMHEGGREGLPERIQKVWDSGCRAFCVESRPHEGFGRQSWWDDMTVILEEARKKDMIFPVSQRPGHERD